jgi:hypothetical protein
MDLPKTTYMAKMPEGTPLPLIFRAMRAETIAGDPNDLWDEVVRPFVPATKEIPQTSVPVVQDDHPGTSQP